MTHKFIVSLVVLCGTISLFTYSLAVARTTPLPASDISLIRHTLPFIDVATLKSVAPDIQQLIVSHLKRLDSPTVTKTVSNTSIEKAKAAIPKLPFYSQFVDITSPSWKKVSCGIASIAMVIDHYSDESVVPDELLTRGINAGAYIDSAGWSHQGLINLAKPYGLTGQTLSYSNLSMSEAFTKLEAAVMEGPVIASVHYTFEPTNPIPHLVVITGIKDGLVYYSDPAEETGNNYLSAEKFKRSWKKRYIEIRPTS